MFGNNIKFWEVFANCLSPCACELYPIIYNDFRWLAANWFLADSMPTGLVLTKRPKYLNWSYYCWCGCSWLFVSDCCLVTDCTCRAGCSPSVVRITARLPISFWFVSVSFRFENFQLFCSRFIGGFAGEYLTPPKPFIVSCVAGNSTDVGYF